MTGRERRSDRQPRSSSLPITKDLKGQKQFTINGQDFQVKEEVSKDFITDHVPKSV